MTRISKTHCEEDPDYTTRFGEKILLNPPVELTDVERLSVPYELYPLDNDNSTRPEPSHALRKEDSGGMGIWGWVVMIVFAGFVIWLMVSMGL